MENKIIFYKYGDLYRPKLEKNFTTYSLGKLEKFCKYSTYKIGPYR